MKMFVKKKSRASLMLICNVVGKGKDMTKDIVGKMNRLKQKVRLINKWTMRERAATLAANGPKGPAVHTPSRVILLSYDSDDDDAVVPSAGCTGGFVAPDTRLPPAIDFIGSFC
jgi:hypothetical protein